MKSHLLLGNDLTRVGNETLAILLKKEVMQINQDPWGRQARRVDAQQPKNTTLLVTGGSATHPDPLAPIQIMQRCDPSEPLQMWRWRNVTQTQGGKTSNGSVLYTVDTQRQAWCLIGWSTSAPTPCNVSDGVLIEGTIRGWEFSPVTYSGKQAWNLSDGPGGRDTANIGYSNQPFSSGPVPNSRWLDKFEPGNNSYTLGAGPYIVDLKALVSEKGGTIQSADTTGIIDDDNAGTVKTGGAFCLAVHSGAALEVWAGLLSPDGDGKQRWAVAMVNRSPSPDTISLDLAKLPDLQLVGLSASHVATGSFKVQDAWLEMNHTVAGAAGKFSREVGTHDTALLIVTKVA